jgi:hypothetical protein
MSRSFSSIRAAYFGKLHLRNDGDENLELTGCEAGARHVGRCCRGWIVVFENVIDCVDSGGLNAWALEGIVVYAEYL